jgi:glycosyltransferase involved in cell wall biosynthesis
VVDDGSSDNTADVARHFPGVQYFYQKNQGLCAARNFGMRNSQGTYLVFLDADDRLRPIALERATNVLDIKPDYAFVSGHTQNIAMDGSPLVTPLTECGDSDHYRMFLQSCYIRTSGAVMFRASIFQSGIFYNPSLFAVGDLDLYLRIARRYPVACHHDVVIEYRRHPEGMSRDAALMLKESLAVLRSQQKYVKNNQELRDAYNAGIRTTKRHFGDRLFVQSKIKCAAINGNAQSAAFLNFLFVIPIVS